MLQVLRQVACSHTLARQELNKILLRRSHSLTEFAPYRLQATGAFIDGSHYSSCTIFRQNFFGRSQGNVLAFHDRSYLLEVFPQLTIGFADNTIHGVQASSRSQGLDGIRRQRLGLTCLGFRSHDFQVGINVLSPDLGFLVELAYLFQGILGSLAVSIGYQVATTLGSVLADGSHLAQHGELVGISGFSHTTDRFQLLTNSSLLAFQVLLHLGSHDSSSFGISHQAVEASQGTFEGVYHLACSRVTQHSLEGSFVQTTTGSSHVGQTSTVSIVDVQDAGTIQSSVADEGVQCVGSRDERSYTRTLVDRGHATGFHRVDRTLATVAIQELQRFSEVNFTAVQRSVIEFTTGLGHEHTGIQFTTGFRESSVQDRFHRLQFLADLLDLLTGQVSVRLSILTTR
ncbi:hypothetical protein [Pseudomonas phage vB_Pae-PA152]|nr:hypothetical protein [Pseudomonas phage vB_Pae-PA152]